MYFQSFLYFSFCNLCNGDYCLRVIIYGEYSLVHSVVLGLMGCIFAVPDVHILS